MQREDNTLERMFLSHKQNKKLKNYVKKFSKLIMTGKVKPRQLARIDPTEIVLPFTTFPHSGQKINIDKELAVIFWER